MFFRSFLISALITISASAEAFKFQDDDTVVFLGNTIVERAQKYGHLETALTLASGKSGLKFRNLGWSGDTVWGTARSYFGPPKVGFNRLKADLAELKPNVILICYGAVAAFEGKDGLPNFLAGYEKLLDMINATAKPRSIVIISPPPAESLGSPLPDMSAHNERLAIFSTALGEFAKKRKHHFSDLFAATPKGKDDPHLTDNGLHLTEKGYEIIAPKFIETLGLTPATQTQLQSDSGTKLREKIIVKNKLFFFRWRPANETYLRLFRKYEQGNNAKELPMFDPIIAQREMEIKTLTQATLANQ